MIMAAAFVSSCSDDDSLASRGLETVEMPISISIPAEGFVSPTDVGIGGEAATPALAATRAFGDPGTAETFELPKYLYIYLVSTPNSGTTQVIFKKEVVKPEDWKLSTSGDNTNKHFSAKDGLYVYQGHLSINLPLDRKEGKVYVAASPVEISDIVTSVDSWSSANNVVNNVTFTSDGDTRKYLKDIYSSPYNLTKTVNGSKVYYGTIEDYASNVPHIDMVLYHVATKVDLQWTIDEGFQGTKEWQQVVKDKNGDSDNMRSTNVSTDDAYNKVFFSYVEARLLPKEKLLIFKPMGMTTRSNSYDMSFLGEEKETGNLQDYTDSKGNTKQRKEYYQVLPDADKSGMYYGRSVIYLIPQRYASGDYYITLKMMVNNYTTSSKTVSESGTVTYSSLLTGEDHATTGHHAYIKIANKDIASANKDADGNPIYTPWIRATLHVQSVTDVENLVKFTNPITYY